MDRTVVALIVALSTIAGCEESIIVPGDTPGLMTIVAGVGDSIGSRVDSTAARTKLSEPRGIAFDDASGILFLADRAATVTSGGITRRVARVFSVRSDGSITLVLDGSACPAANCPEAVHSIALDASGRLLLADPVGHRLYRLSPGQSPEVIAGTGVAGDSPDGTSALSAMLRAPAGIVVDPDGRILFSEQLGHRIRAIRADGTIETVAGTGSPGRTGDGGAATSATLAGPSGLALSTGGILFIADRLNGRIRSVSLQTGIIATLAGTDPGFGGDGGPADAARLDRPESVAVSADGRTLYVADAGNNRVRAIGLQSGLIRTFAGTGSTAFNGAGRPAGDTSLNAPGAVATSAGGFLFIADTGHSAVWRTRILAEALVR